MECYSWKNKLTRRRLLVNHPSFSFQWFLIDKGGKNRLKIKLETKYNMTSY